jgi:signal transduction histidine kinase
LIQAKAIHPFGYVVKPVEDHDLSTAIEVALSRHQAEIATQNALNHEKELSQLKSQFVSLISHEFRNPLNSILSILNLLNRQDLQFSREEQLSHMQRAIAAATQLTQLIDDVLVLGETETAKFQCYPAPLDVLWFCRNLLEELRSAPDCRHSILLVLQGCQENDQPFYELDVKLIRHILNNLLSNAIKYSPNSDEVKLTICCEPRSITFQVQDRGMGIPAEDQSYLFDPFHRGTNAGNIRGTGLGLSIVKRCVDAHGGSIAVESQLGVGTTFRVTIPLGNGEEPDEQESNDQNTEHH